MIVLPIVSHPIIPSFLNIYIFKPTYINYTF